MFIILGSIKGFKYTSYYYWCHFTCEVVPLVSYSRWHLVQEYVKQKSTHTHGKEHCRSLQVKHIFGDTMQIATPIKEYLPPKYVHWLSWLFQLNSRNCSCRKGSPASPFLMWAHYKIYLREEAFSVLEWEITLLY